MSESLDIQLARHGDAAPISRMSRDLVEYGLPWRWRPNRVRQAIRRAETCVIKTAYHGQLTGFAIMDFGVEHAHLNLIAVAGGCQRRGIGRALVGWLEQSARVAGISVVHLELRATNHGGLAFYRSLGYREIGRAPDYYSGREAALAMARDLWQDDNMPVPQLGGLDPRWAELLMPPVFSASR